MDQVKGDADETENIRDPKRLELCEGQQPFPNFLPLELFVRRQLADEGDRVLPSRRFPCVRKRLAAHGLHRERDVAQDARCANIFNRYMRHPDVFRGMSAGRLAKEHVHPADAAVKGFPVMVGAQRLDQQW